jgi:hypothetical protein
MATTSKFRQFVVYAKLTITLLILLGVVVLIFQNRNYTTKFWPWADKEAVPTLWLMLATSVLSVVVFWILSKMRRVFREVGELAAQSAKEKQLAVEEQRRRELVEQEKRIDQKLKQALDSDKSHPAG